MTLKSIEKQVLNLAVKAAIENPDLPIDFIQDLLTAKSDVNPKLEPFIAEINTPIKPHKAP